MTSFLWTLSDLENLRMGYLYGLFDYDEFRTRHAEMRSSNASTVSVPNLSDGGNGDRRGSDLDGVWVDGVSGGLNTSADLPHRPDGLFNQTEEMGS